MPEATADIDNMRLCVVLGSDQATHCALQELLKFAPGADLRVSDQALHRPKSWTALIQRAELRYLNPVRHCEPGPVRPLSAAPIEADLILDLRGGVPDPALAAQARYGLWSTGPCDAGAPLRGETSLPVSLLGLAPGDTAPRLVAQARVQVKWLPEHSRLFALEKAVQLFRREWARLGQTGSVPDLGPAPGPSAPVRFSDLLCHGLRVGREAIGRKIRFPGIDRHRRPFTLKLGHGSPDNVDLAGATDLPLPHKGLRADPFLIEKEGGLYCFYEDFPDGTARGVIAVSKVEKDGMHDLGTVLETDYHLSYPFIFEHEGEVYMMPETVAAQRVEIWRATEFPIKWERHCTALEGERFADPVIFRRGGEWWFMASPCHDSLGDFSSEIWLFKTDGPFLRQLTPHTLNPVVLGSTAGRGAGRVFEDGGRLLRMAQDNSGLHYGYGMKMMEITELSMTAYEERCIRQWRGPDIPGAIGCHHLDFAAGRFVADVRWP